MTYQPGAQMHLSDAISRLSTHKNEGKTIANLDVSIHAIEELLTLILFQLTKFINTHQRIKLQLLIQHINNGFPDSSKTISSCEVCLTFSDRQQREPYISDV